MSVIAGLRRRFCTFCDLALVSKARHPSRNPYHMATAWMEPSWLTEHSVTGRRSCKNASTSSSVILIMARWLTPWPICSVMGGTLGPGPDGQRLEAAGEGAGGDRAL